MTNIVPAPDVALSSQFPTNADRVAGVFNAKAAAWADSSRTMAADMDDAAKSAETNAIAAQEQAQAAQVSATTATEQADAALGYRNEAVNAKDLAVPAAAAAAASEDFMRRMNLGPHATFPTLDNQGRELLEGAEFLYTGVTPAKRYSWDGTQWLVGTNVTAGVSQVDGKTGALSLADTSYPLATPVAMEAGESTEPVSVTPALVRKAAEAAIDRMPEVIRPGTVLVTSGELPSPEYLRAGATYLRAAYPETAKRVLVNLLEQSVATITPASLGLSNSFTGAPKVSLSGDLIAVRINSSPASLKIIDVSNPSAPVLHTTPAGDMSATHLTDDELITIEGAYGYTAHIIRRSGTVWSVAASSAGIGANGLTPTAIPDLYLCKIGSAAVSAKTLSGGVLVDAALPLDVVPPAGFVPAVNGDRRLLVLTRAVSKSVADSDGWGWVAAYIFNAESGIYERINAEDVVSDSIYPSTASTDIAVSARVPASSIDTIALSITYYYASAAYAKYAFLQLTDGEYISAGDASQSGDGVPTISFPRGGDASLVVVRRSGVISAVLRSSVARFVQLGATVNGEFFSGSAVDENSSGAMHAAVESNNLSIRKSQKTQFSFDLAIQMQAIKAIPYIQYMRSYD